MKRYFKVGDKVRVISDHEVWLDDNNLPHDHIFEIVDDTNTPSHDYITDDFKKISVVGVCRWPDDFELVEEKPEEIAGYTIINHQGTTPQPPITIVNDIKPLYHSGGFSKPEYRTLEIRSSDRYIPPVPNTTIEPNVINVTVCNGEPETETGKKIAEYIKNVYDKSGIFGEESLTLPEKELGTYRPVLEERKIGKVPMHMVIDGFPLALNHIAEIMGWANDVKGYKLHDWRNLPDASTAFPSANYRHMIENSKQKANGLNAIERVDHESSKLHIGHQIFNLLSELELILMEKIK